MDRSRRHFGGGIGTESERVEAKYSAPAEGGYNAMIARNKRVRELTFAAIDEGVKDALVKAVLCARPRRLPEESGLPSCKRRTA